MPAPPIRHVGIPARLQFLRFAGVGAGGFLVDAAVLWLAMAAGAGALPARAASYLVAVTFTWALNRTVTFRDARQDRLLAQWARFLAVNALGGCVNYAIFAALVLAGGPFARWPVLAVAAGSISALGLNYAVSKRLVFRAA
ncbi:GtrA family protein [Arenibaculum pallidiluteum]|uniref:GtrA family protein n=1 Tax=Arenibaculum pallidiluteum TaxID=2812559 RepID=UPI001A977D7F|nr:GtrA family protein [Arenibaculum pallidiluteum]